jgi:hypothetical protein
MNKDMQEWLISAELNKFILLINSSDFDKFDEIKQKILKLVNEEV